MQFNIFPTQEHEYDRMNNDDQDMEEVKGEISEKSETRSIESIDNGLIISSDKQMIASIIENQSEDIHMDDDVSDIHFYNLKTDAASC